MQIHNSNNTQTPDAVQALIDQLRAENEALKAAKKSGPRRLTMKVSAKGGLSVYGLGRFPITLYKAQWLKLLGIVDEIRAFLKEHDSEFTTK